MKTGLVLEGGAMRGIYTAGVLDIFNENNTYNEIKEKLIGKVIFKIPYVALPTIWIHNLNIKTQVDVETGK